MHRFLLLLCLMHAVVWSQFPISPSLHTCTHTHVQLVMGEEAVLTFSCTTVMEREEWTEAFRILNQLAQPYGSSKQATPPITGEGGGRGEGERVGERRGVCKGRSSRVVWPVPEKTALTRERERMSANWVKTGVVHPCTSELRNPRLLMWCCFWLWL